MLKNLREFFLIIFIPLLYFLAIFIILKTKSALGFGMVFLSILGVIAAFAGLFLWGIGFITLGPASFSVSPKAKILKISGIYRYFRHSIYLGITLTCFGLSLGLGSKIGLFYTIFIVIPLNLVRAWKEEKVLIRKFGQEYLEYKKKTIF